MKRLCVLLLCFLLTCCFFSAGHSASAISGSASFSGPTLIRAGDSFTVDFIFNGTGVSGIQGNITFDPAKLSLSGNPETAIGGGWTADYHTLSGKISFTAYDSKGTSPINAAQTIFKLTFVASASVGAGTQITVNSENVVASDGVNEISPANASYSKAVSPPLSTNNNLSLLAASNAVLSPAFTPAVTGYTASVGYDITKLDISAAAADGLSKVTIDNPQLTAGGKTKITVSVTAESGAKKTYTITVTRAQDPDYERKNNARLSALTVENATTSPAFNPGITEYTAEVPFEISQLAVSASPENSAAKISVNSPPLTAGSGTKVTVTVTAESGAKKTYTITVTRAPEPDAETDTVTPEPDAETDASQTPVLETPGSGDDPAKKPIWIFSMIAGVLFGAVAGYFFNEFLRKKRNTPK
ncbi:MAG: cadherin-like beta sandwich domain-containing protein [Oscillospiraceae bacterium]|jgi:hypothetical protein|nr:cadherin-like beta sandwich domain-containing protein [Oscillospiraceae bacterium]